MVCVFCCGHGQCQHAPELSGDCSRYLDSHSRRSYNNRVHNCSKFLPFQFRKRRFRCTRKIVGTGGEEEAGGEAGKFALFVCGTLCYGGRGGAVKLNRVFYTNTSSCVVRWTVLGQDAVLDSDRGRGIARGDNSGPEEEEVICFFFYFFPLFIALTRPNPGYCQKY